jgi:hypothetical protein
MIATRSREDSRETNGRELLPDVERVTERVW